MTKNAYLLAGLTMLLFSLLGVGCGDDEEETDDSCLAFCEKVNTCAGGEEQCAEQCADSEYVASKEAVYCCVDKYDECDEFSACILITDGTGCDALPGDDDDDSTDDDDDSTDDDDDSTDDDDDNSDDDDDDPVYSCVPSADATSNSCDYHDGVCEPAQNYSTGTEFFPCCEDQDCGCSDETGDCFFNACEEDGHCDGWCPAGTDPDCVD